MRLGNEIKGGSREDFTIRGRWASIIGNEGRKVDIEEIGKEKGKVFSWK